MDTSGEIAILIKYSPKREQKLESIKLTYEEDESVNRISKLSTTRWTVRANCFQRIIDNYHSLYELWDVCLEESDLNRDVESRIIGCKTQMEKFDYYFGLKLGKLIYSLTSYHRCFNLKRCPPLAVSVYPCLLLKPFLKCAILKASTPSTIYV